MSSPHPEQEGARVELVDNCVEGGTPGETLEKLTEDSLTDEAIAEIEVQGLQASKHS